jgi:hypothetical protein
LGKAAARALSVDPRACRDRALRSGWDVCSREFEGNLAPCDAGRFEEISGALPPRSDLGPTAADSSSFSRS